MTLLPKSSLGNTLDDRLVPIAAWLAIAVGATGLGGWLFDLPLLKTVLPGLVTIKPNTAATFIILGLALRLHQQPAGRPPIRQTLGSRAAQGMACTVTAIGLLSLIENITGWDPGIDHLLFRETAIEAVGSVRPGLMSPVTATGFLLLGLALACPDWNVRRKIWPAEFLALSAGLLALFACVDLVLASTAYHTGIALQTAIALLVLSAGTLCLRHDWGLRPLLLPARPAGAIGVAPPGEPSAVGPPGWRLRYGLAVLTVIAATALRHQLGLYFGMTAPYIVYYPAIMLAAVIGGMGPGLLATLLSAICAAYYFLAPPGLAVDSLGDVIGVVLFGVMGFAISLLAGSLLTRTQALFESERSLKEAQRIAQLGNWELDLVHNNLTWSDEIYRIFGIDPQQFAASYEAFLDLVHPDDRAAVNRAYTESVRDHTPYTIIHRLRMPDGQVKFVQECGQTFYDHTGRPVRSVGTVQDVTERQRAEAVLQDANDTLARRVEERTRALAGERATLETMFDAVDVGLFLIDEHGAVRRRNRVLSVWTDREIPEGTGAQCGDVLGCMHAMSNPGGCGCAPACRSCSLRQAFTSVLHSGQPVRGVEFAAVLARKDGEQSRCFEVNVAPVRINSSLHAVVCLHDVTKRKHALHAIEGLNQELARRAHSLEQSNKELESFSYSVSHDLRAPLRSIDGFSRILLRDDAAKLGDAGRQNLQRVRSASQRMGELIDDLLKLARTSRAEMHCRPVDLTALAQSVIADLQVAEPARSTTCAITASLSAHADPTLIRTVLENLLGNAWKFTGRTPDARIEFGAMPATGESIFFIRDNGAGFDMRYADKLFGPFQRLHAAGDFPGTGIGLATTQRIIHRHGGRIWAESKVAAGSTFYFTLPAQPRPP